MSTSRGLADEAARPSGGVLAAAVRSCTSIVGPMPRRRGDDRELLALLRRRLVAPEAPSCRRASAGGGSAGSSSARRWFRRALPPSVSRGPELPRAPSRHRARPRVFVSARSPKAAELGLTGSSSRRGPLVGRLTAPADRPRRTAPSQHSGSAANPPRRANAVERRDAAEPEPARASLRRSPARRRREPPRCASPTAAAAGNPRGAPRRTPETAPTRRSRPRTVTRGHAVPPMASEPRPSDVGIESPPISPDANFWQRSRLRSPPPPRRRRLAAACWLHRIGCGALLLLGMVAGSLFSLSSKVHEGPRGRRCFPHPAGSVTTNGARYFSRTQARAPSTIQRPGGAHQQISSSDTTFNNRRRLESSKLGQRDAAGGTSGREFER